MFVSYGGGMPRVSDEHRRARRRQILDAARRCFVRNGFHATSMQDLFAEAGLSSGAVYGHFASKDEVIIAIAEDNLRAVLAMVETLAATSSDRPLGARLADMLDIATANHERDHGAVALLVWAEALRNRALAERLIELVDRLRGELVEDARAAQREERLPADADPEGLAAVLMAIVPGCLMQSALLGPSAVAGAGDALRAIWGGE